jgi:hypothetical protein
MTKPDPVTSAPFNISIDSEGIARPIANPNYIGNKQPAKPMTLEEKYAELEEQYNELLEQRDTAEDFLLAMYETDYNLMPSIRELLISRGLIQESQEK